MEWMIHSLDQSVSPAQRGALTALPETLANDFSVGNISQEDTDGTMNAFCLCKIFNIDCPRAVIKGMEG
jgi:hypothetical protein